MARRKAIRVNQSHLRPAEHLRSFMRPTLATTPTAQYVLSPSSRMTELYVCSACIYFTKDAGTCLWSVSMMNLLPALTAERVCQELRQWSLTSDTFPHLQQDPDSRAKGTPVPNHKTRHQSWLLSSPIPSTRKSTDTFQW